MPDREVAGLLLSFEGLEPPEKFSMCLAHALDLRKGAYAEVDPVVNKVESRGLASHNYFRFEG